jgi:hypothetical protein
VPSARRELRSRDRHGRDFTCVVTCAPMLQGDAHTGAVILIAEPDAG